LILVLCGTQMQDFSRMIRVVENLADNNQVVVQAGHTKYKSPKMEIFDFIPSDKMKELYKNADYIITHAGAGSMFQAIKTNKKTLVFPRLQKYGEHVDDHQLQLSQKLEDLGYLIVFDENDEIHEKFLFLQQFIPRFYNLTGNIPTLINNCISDYLGL